MSELVRKAYFAGNVAVELEGTVSDGQFTAHGDVRLTLPTGAVTLEGQYLHGRPNGRWLQWYDDGTLRAEYLYAFGKPLAVKRYWDNGALALESKHDDGFWSYAAQTFDKSGKGKTKRRKRAGRLIFWERVEDDSKHRLFDAVNGVFIRSADHGQRFCTLDQSNTLRCKTAEQLWETLVDEGYSPDQADKYLAALNDLYNELGLDGDILTACAGTFVATESDSSSDATVVVAADHNSAEITASEFQEINAACNAAVLAALAEGGIDASGPESDQRTQDTITAIDEAVASCRADANSLIAVPAGALIVIAALEAGKWAAGAAAGGVLGNSIYDWLKSDSAWSKPEPVGLDEMRSVNRETGTEKTENSRTGVTTYVTNTSTGKVVRKVYSDGSESYEYYDKAGDLVRVSGRDAEGNEAEVEIPKSEPKQGSVPEPSTGLTPPEAPPSPGGGTGSGVGNPGDPGLDKCEALAQWWANKKYYCDLSNWQSYDCRETLRVFDGCADPALIYPSPDGSDSIGCTRRKDEVTLESARSEMCRRRGMIMVPSGFGADICLPRDLAVRPETDPCALPDAFGCPGDWDVPDEPSNRPHPFVNRARAARTPRLDQQHRVLRALQSPSVYDNVADLTESTFDAEVLGGREHIHFVVFSAPSCGPCSKVLSLFSRVSAEYEAAAFHRVDVPQNPALRERFDIRYTPTILVFCNGEQIGQRRVGAASSDVLHHYIVRSIKLSEVRS